MRILVGCGLSKSTDHKNLKKYVENIGTLINNLTGFWQKQKGNIFVNSEPQRVEKAIIQEKGNNNLLLFV